MYQKEAPASIQCLFDSIADHYDTTNAVLSFSLHKYWNRTLARHLSSPHSSNAAFVDLCSGTGDITFEYLRLAKFPCQASLVDFSTCMLKRAKEKASRLPFTHIHQLSYVEADVHHLPLPDQTSDRAAMAYGIRNVQHPERCMREVFRILKEGGCFGILELTRPPNPLLRLGHRLYLRLLPFLGKRLARNEPAYRYLCQSIQTFLEPEEIERLLQRAGFTSVRRRSLTGGIATLFIGQKGPS